MDKIAPCLWFVDDARQAVEFYTSLVPDSGIDFVMAAPADYPGGKAGQDLLIGVRIAGRSFQAMNGGEHDKFNDAISMSIACEDQAEVDRIWDALTADGGRPVACGWCKDRWGMSWQVVPKRMMALINGPDPAVSKRVFTAMTQMVKIDMAEIERAAAG